MLTLPAHRLPADARGDRWSVGGVGQEAGWDSKFHLCQRKFFSNVTSLEAGANYSSAEKLTRCVKGWRVMLSHHPRKPACSGRLLGHHRDTAPPHRPGFKYW